MITRHTGALVSIGVVTAGLLAVPCLAQPANGPEANGKNYQPSRGQVTARERAAGIATSQKHEQAVDHELDQLDRQLLQQEGVNPGRAPLAPAAGTSQP